MRTQHSARALASIFFALLVGATLPAGCGSRPILSEVSVEPSAITPDGDGVADVAQISYTIGAPAVVTMTLQNSETGARHVFRDGSPRSPGTYEAMFGGVVDGRMVPDGEYVLEVAAEPREAQAGTSAADTGERAVERLSLAIHGGDTEPPELAAFMVQPDEFSPNQDGLGDRVSISYRLDEPAEVRLWLETAEGEYVTDILEEKESADFPGEPGPHVYDFDAGVDADAPPPPNGDYIIVGRAEDAAGNITEQRLSLKIRDGGQPRIALLGDVEWSDTIVPLGSTLSFSVTVANMGDTPIRTRGPEPGFVYDNAASFNMVAPDEVLLLAKSGDSAKALHVPADSGDFLDIRLDLAADGSDRRSRAPTEAAVTTTTAITICGTVLQGERSIPGAHVYAFEADGDNGIHAVTDDEGRFCFRELPRLASHERTYSRSSGAMRLGLEYDEIRTDLAYPYRWQLGNTEDLAVCESGDRLYLCLPPGASAVVHGGVRFVEPPFRRQTNVYVALMHEDVRRIQGPYGQQQITVEY